MGELLELLAELDVDPSELTPDRRLRAHLGLDSTETVELESELRERYGLAIDLWDDHDYTLGEVAALMTDARARG